jgi:ABC-type transporter Mla MlaB component
MALTEKSRIPQLPKEYCSPAMLEVIAGFGEAPPEIEIDLQEVCEGLEGEIDSINLALLVGMRREAERTGRKISFHDPTEKMRTTFINAGLVCLLGSAEE